MYLAKYDLERFEGHPVSLRFNKSIAIICCLQAGGFFLFFLRSWAIFFHFLFNWLRPFYFQWKRRKQPTRHPPHRLYVSGLQIRFKEEF